MADSEVTKREEIIELLSVDSYTIKDLAEYFEVNVKTIVNDLTHIQQTLRNNVSKKILVKPAECIACQFIFSNRSKIKDPKKCPKCHNERIKPRMFKIIQK